MSYEKLSVLNLEAIKEVYQLVIELKAENERLKRAICEYDINNKLCLN